MKEENIKLRALREKMNLSMAEFGRRIEYSPTHVKRMEEGATPVSAKCVQRICDVFNVNPQYFTVSSGIPVSSIPASSGILASSIPASSVTSLGAGADEADDGMVADELDRLLSMYLKTVETEEPAEDERVPDGKAGTRIKTLRTEVGLSQRQFALKAGVNNSLISEVEAGNRELSIYAAKKIEDAFEVGHEWLLYGDSEKKDCPVDKKMIDWLWENREVRKELRERMKKGLSII